MPINFVPKRGAILMCDFGPESGVALRPTLRGPLSVKPEMDKVRRCIVVSDDQFNLRHGAGPGLCMVVPCSASVPKKLDETMVPLLQKNYRALTRDIWAKCSMATPVSHDRLDRPRVGGQRITDWASRADMALIEAGLRAAMKL